MRYLRIHGPSPLQVLLPAASTLDACWWYIGGEGFTMHDFARRTEYQNFSEQEVENQWLQLLTDYVDHDTPVGRVGKPGFFTRLCDSLALNWSCYFAIKADAMPMASLQCVSENKSVWNTPIEGLPPDVVLVIRDIDGGYQEYGFADERMCKVVAEHLRNTGYTAEEVLEG